MAIPIDPRLLAPQFAAAQNTTPLSWEQLTSRSFTIPLPQKEQNANHPVEDSDEWEYEYSSTETDTYYLTLDLTPPNEPSTQFRKLSTRARGGRGGYRQRWVNPNLTKKKGPLSQGAATISVDSVRKASEAASTPAVEEDENVAGAVEEKEEDEEGGQGQGDGDVGGGGGGGGEENAGETVESGASSGEKKAKQIQILDLHTSNPVIAYKGNVYSCHWANNIGTELLFTVHDDQNPLPALRALPDGLDLLAASTARIVSSSVKLIPKDSTTTAPAPIDEPASPPPTPSRGRGRGRGKTKTRGSRGARATQNEQSHLHSDPEAQKYIYTGHLTSSIPPVRDSTPSTIPTKASVTGSNTTSSAPTLQLRHQQASFLERLASVKHGRGEEDPVTVQTIKRLRPVEWRSRVAELKAMEEQGLGNGQGVVGGGGGGGDEGVVPERIVDTSGEMQDQNVSGSRAEAGGRPRGRGRGRGRRRASVVNNMESVAVSHGDGTSKDKALSTPTPERWNELSGAGRGVGGQMDGIAEEEGYKDEEDEDGFFSDEEEDEDEESGSSVLQEEEEEENEEEDEEEDLYGLEDGL